MEPQDRLDQLARERARRRRAQQIRRRRTVLGACVVGLIILIVALSVGLSGSDETTTTSTGETSSTTSTSLTSTTYTAELSGDQSVPPVETEAKATFTLKYNSEDSSLSYVLDITSELTDPTAATIYEGSPGTSGVAVVNLLANPPEAGTRTGVLAEGVIEDADLIGSLQGQTIQELLTLVASGNTYVSIGNTSHAVDAIRGQIQ